VGARADEQVKLIVLGNGSVGKSSIINRFVEDGFRRVYKQVRAFEETRRLLASS
jgi:GTPase SAR1 family protein